MFKIAIVLIMSLYGSSFANSFIDYRVNGAIYQGYHAKPTTSPKGLVILIHDWDGLTEYEIKRSNMLAKKGYETFAVDLYGKGNRPVETKAKKEETGKLYNDREKMRNLILSGISQARKVNNQKAVVMGYCFGGAAVLELARSGKSKDIKGYASFHGGLKTPNGQSYPKKSGPFFIAHGGADKAIPMDDVRSLAEQLEKSESTYDIEIYSGAPHAFTVFDSNRYRERADRKSWESFLNFLDYNL